MSFINTYQTYMSCYTTENKIMKLQMNKKKKEHSAQKTHSTRQ